MLLNLKWIIRAHSFPTPRPNCRGLGTPTFAKRIVGAVVDNIMKCSVYIIESLKTREYYIGSSYDPNLRLKLHNSGNVKATKYKRPYRLLFFQEFKNIKIARKVERKIKSWKRKNFIDKIITDKKIKIADNMGT